MERGKSSAQTDFLAANQPSKGKENLLWATCNKANFTQAICFKITLNNKEIASSRSYGGQGHFVFIA